MSHVNRAVDTAPLSSVNLRFSNYRFTLLLLSLFFTIRLTIPMASSTEVGTEEYQDTNVSLSQEAEKRTGVSDPRRIMCGYQLIVNLKQQCGDRGTYSPYADSGRVRRGLRLHRATQLYKPGKVRRRKHDEFCALYLRYEPYTIITECCCRGCTRRFLEQYCAKD
ncbi:unnamed protein product [Hymenolepis diminuta]|uniref:Insulin-like domain-containing protein n=1 Tax=Hymenolepis diminuta TaxID=6216 RepID=A0A564Y079_HYMDI|nr:unnamed protein product [Hymenolepis diminuta]VUZ40707.1 unnamed protein product [Hymenolepis diminuta]VUZ52421.1 unnamed protein product [Hymenolepis diminuta]